MVELGGRVQSRVYEKKLEDGSSITKVAYEVSVSRFLEVKKEENAKDNDEE